MNKLMITYDPSTRPVYAHLDPIVDFLISNGNYLARDFKWGENRTGYFCFMAEKIDFDRIEQLFIIPDFIRLDRENDAIECDQTWTSIRGGMSVS